MISTRVQNIEASKSIALSAKIAELRRSGQDIIGLNVGEPDFNTPPEIIEATYNALKSNETKYSLVPGLVELREALVKKLQKENNLKVGIENISVSNGSKQCLYNIFQTILNPGDEVLIIRPYWVSFPESVKLAGGVPVYVESRQDLQLDLENITKSITSKTKAIIINTPNNPSGAVYSKESLLALGDIAEKNDLYIISDEAYETLVYDGEKHTSIASLSNSLFNRTFSVLTFSKSYCMTGFRVGYIVAEESLIQNVNKLQSHLNGNVCTFAQHGALKALTMDQKVFSDMLDEFSKRKSYLLSRLENKFNVQNTHGAFYLFPKVDHLYNDNYQNDQELALYILEEAKVAVLPGSAFGQQDYLRFCFASNLENLELAMDRIEAIL